MPGTLLTATFVTGGSVVVDDSVAVTAITALTSTVAANTVAINTTMGVLGSKIPGNVSSSMALQVAMQANMVKALNAIEKNQQVMITALHNVSASLEANTKAVASVASASQDIAIMTTTATADQIRNNKIMQKVTNQALIDAGKPPVVVQDDELNAVFTQTLTDMKSMTAIQFTYKAVDRATEMLTNSAKWTLQWAGETKVAKFFTDAYASAKASVLALFPKETADTVIRESKAIQAETQSGTFA
jgi:hypothetical protein